MTFSGVVSRNTSPTASLLSAVTSLNATGTTLGAPLAQVASVCPICQEALSDEESAEAPPAAEEARRFRGSVLTAGRGSGWEPADTTVSAEEHAKKSPPKWVVIYVITHRFCCSHPRISQGRGSVRGKPLRVSPLAFNHPPAGDRFCAAKSPLQKNDHPKGGRFFWSGRRGSNPLPGIPRMAVAIRRSPASPLDLTRFAQVEAASSPVLRHIPKRIPHPVGWGILFGAGDEARTRYLDLGKVALYQMSYARKRRRCCGTLVPPVGVEPTTRGFSVRCSTN